jgi:hypothetical protein
LIALSGKRGDFQLSFTGKQLKRKSAFLLSAVHGCLSRVCVARLIFLVLKRDM